MLWSSCSLRSSVAPAKAAKQRIAVPRASKLVKNWSGLKWSDFSIPKRQYTEAKQTEYTKHEHFQQAFRELRENTPLACLETSRKILKDEPNNPVVNLFAAVSQFYLGQNEEALAHLEKVILVRPKDLEAHLLKGQVLEKMGQDSKALLYYESALKIKDRHLKTVLARARLLEKMGRFEDAAAGYRKANFIERTWKTSFRAAECYYAIQKYREALEYYDMALETWKFEPMVYIGRARVLVDTGKHRSAIDTLDDLLYEVPNEPRGLLYKGIIHHTHLNEHTKALDITTTLLGLGQDEDLTVLALRASCLQKLEQYAESMDIWEKVLLRAPNDATALRAKADILECLGSPDAVAAKELAEEHESQESATLMEDGSKYWKQGRFDRALICYDKIAKMEPESPVAHMGRGVALTHLGRTKEAKSALQYAIALQPKMPIAHYYLGKIYRSTDEFESAIKSFKKAFKQQPENIDAILQVALLYEQLKEYGDAVDAYDELLEVAPEHEEAKKAKLALLKKANSL